MVRAIVLKVLKSQGVPNPSDDVIDNAIKEYTDQQVLHKHVNNYQRQDISFL
jgi:hypothetical protein